MTIVFTVIFIFYEFEIVFLLSNIEICFKSLLKTCENAGSIMAPLACQNCSLVSIDTPLDPTFSVDEVEFACKK